MISWFWIQLLTFSWRLSFVVNHYTEFTRRNLLGYRQKDMDSLKFFDAWGKINAGVLQGNLNWIGQSSECRDIETVQSKQRIVQLVVYSNGRTQIEGSDMKLKKNSTSEGTGAFNFTVLYGVCFPSRCSDAEVKTTLEKMIWQPNRNSLETDKKWIKIGKVFSESPGKLDAYFAVAVTLYCLLLMTIIIATIMDYVLSVVKQQQIQFHQKITQSSANKKSFDTGQEADAEKVKFERFIWFKFLLCFSLRRNILEFYSSNSSYGTISCLNGIRVLSIAWIILGDSAEYLVNMKPGVTFYCNNALFLFERYLKSFAFHAVSNSGFAHDTFFTISGFLSSFLTLRKLEHVGKIKFPFWSRFYIRRYVRYTPPLMFIVLFIVGIWKVLGNGTGPGVPVMFF